MEFSLLVLIVLQVTSLVRAQGVSGACSNAMNVCGGTMYSEIDAAASDNAAICAAVDKALGCVATETVSCDLLAKADISAGMKDIIAIYQEAPYQCTMVNANEPAFNDHCVDQLSFCVNIYYESEYTPTTTEACQGFDYYLNCMQTNTSSCTDPAALAIITESVSNATTKMNTDPYFCSERDTYDIAACENGFFTCVDPLSAIGTTGYDSSSVVCSEITIFAQCVEANNVNCSPRLKQQYLENANNLTITFQGDPYYCGSENPCLEAFKGCNKSENEIQPAAGCDLMALYDACMTSVSAICDPDKLALTTPEVDTLKQQLDTEFGCTTTTTTVSTTTTTTTTTTSPTTTTTTSSTTTTTTPTTTTTTIPATTTQSQTGGNSNQRDTSTPSWSQHYGGAVTTTFSILTTIIMVTMSLFLS